MRLVTVIILVLFTFTAAAQSPCSANLPAREAAVVTDTGSIVLAMLPELIQMSSLQACQLKSHDDAIIEAQKNVVSLQTQVAQITEAINKLGAQLPIYPQITAAPPPVCTAIACTLTWTTNVATDTYLKWGTVLGSPSKVLAGTLDVGGVLRHNATATGLMPGTRYYFYVMSKDANGNVATPLWVPGTTLMQ